MGLLLLSSEALAGDGPSTIDPYQIIITDILPNGPAAPVGPNVAPSTSQSLDLTKKNLVIIVAGQSNLGNPAPSAYSPTNGSSLFNFNIWDGAIYPAADPLVGCNSVKIGNPALRLADSIVTAALFDRVYLVPIAIGGTTVAQWDSGPLNNFFKITFMRLAQRGIVAGANVTIVVIWGQGESDNLAGTSQANYTTGITDVINQTRQAGFTGSFYVAEQTWNSGTSSTAVQNSQLAIVNHPSGIYAGPVADALIGTCGGSACRQADNTHFSDTGSASYAAAWLAALQAGKPF